MPGDVFNIKGGQRVTGLPRGIRNNNPGNIVRSGTAWDGMAEIQDDRRFAVFRDPLWGVRAMMKTLVTYRVKHDLRTVFEIIRRWAPPDENRTTHYAWHVARRLKIKPSQEVDTRDGLTLIALAKAICVHENGHPPPGWPADWYTDEVYRRAAQMALGGPDSQTTKPTTRTKTTEEEGG